MKKIFLLDDEVQVREGIQNCIDWTGEGFEYCGDAPDGEVALPLIEKYQPDIVITDIKMPFMDGLEVSRILRKKMPSVKIIILSGHDEFEYAREALRIQIAEYCLKPISAAELLKTLHKVSLQIDQEELEMKRITDLSNQASKSVSKTHETFLNELCEGIYSASEAIKKATNLGIDLISSYYYILIVETESLESGPIDWIKDHYPCLHFKRNSKEIVFMMKGELSSKLENEANLLRERMLTMCNKDFEGSFIFGFGKVEKRIHGISVSFSQAEDEKNYNKIVQKYSSKGNTGDTCSSHEVFFSYRNELIQFLKNGDPTKIAIFSREYSFYLTEANNSTPFFIYYSLIDFTITIKHYIKEVWVNHSDILEEVKKLEMRAGWIRDDSEVYKYISDMLQLVMESGMHSHSKFSPIINKAKEYIDEHFHDSQLSLQSVAKLVNVSPSYFSHMFSQETGQTLIEYITMIRMEQAKRLLKSTNDKTYEIAQIVGYSDSHYFCNLFKKVTGMTTREFKNRG